MKAYLIYGVILCMLFFAAGMRGYVVASMLLPAQWSPPSHGVHK